MLSRKGSNAGMMMAVAPAVVDRTRVGERLHAALAGLQELHLLRDRQSEMVGWALRVDREEPVTSVHHNPKDSQLIGAEEQRLEATLTALKQQLSRLRKQDVGLKTHLQQLDQQINELKLDVNKASTDQQENDSRPSSGFYELSDGGSGSLSNSCTSVYSACMSSSPTSFPVSPPTSHMEAKNQAEVSRRRSADECTTHHGAPPRAKGLHLGSSRIRASTEKARPRPVSTGDLERMLGQIQSYNKEVDTSKPPASQNVQTSPVDSKFHSNLVSRTGAEVYHYPSPLHAVALQSPMFSPNNEPNTNGLLEAPYPLVNGTNSLQRPPNYDTKTLGYIDKILQRSFSKLNFESGTHTLQSQHSHRKSSEVVTAFPEVSQNKVSALPPPIPTTPQTTNVVPAAQGNDQKRHYTSQEAADNTKQYKQLLRPHEGSHRLSFPADIREYSSDEVTMSTLKKASKIPTEYLSLSRSHSDYRSSDNTEPRHERKGHKQRSAVCQSSSTEEGQSFEVAQSTSPQFVHAKFVPAGSQRVKVRQADRKSKNVKLKKKSGEKPRKLQHGYSSGEKSKDSSSGKSEQKKFSKGKVMQKSPVYMSDEHRRGSGSDCSHCSPGFMYTQKIQAKPLSNTAVSKSSKNRNTQNMEFEVDQRKKRQGERQMDIYQAQMAYRQRSREPPVPSAHMVRSMSARAGQWMQQSTRHFPTSMSANSFQQNLNARYPAAPYHMTSMYPPRCESEYSAECASLFHSTIAASSDGEMSDHTANRFGDSESSQSYQSFSDSDSSLSFDEEDFVDEEGGLVWANTSLGPMAAGHPVQQQQQQHPPRPTPSACRIKASRALKKKIRRFQPASLKVMTLV